MPTLSPGPIPLLLVAVACAQTGCFGRANPRIEKIEEDREGGAVTTFKYDDAGFPTSASRKLGDAVVTHRLKWTDGVLSALSFSEKAGDAEGVTVKVKPTLDADDRITGWTYARDNGDETVATLVYDEEDRLLSFDSKTNNTRNGATSESSTTWTYQGAVLESVAGTTSTRVSGARTTTSSTSTFSFEEDRLVSLILDVGSLRTETTFVYDKAGLLESSESALFGAGTLSRTRLEIDRDEDDLVASYEKSVLVDGDETDTYAVEISYGDGDARGMDMAPAEIGGLWDLRGNAYTAPDGELSALRQLMSW